MNAGDSYEYCLCLSFSGFFRPDLSPWGYRNRCFFGCTVLPDSHETNFEGKKQEASPSASHLLWQMSSQWGPQQLLQGLVSHELMVYLLILSSFLLNEMAILSKGRKPDKFESHNSLKTLVLLIFEVFVRISLNVNLSSDQNLLTFLLCVRQTWIT